MIRKMKSNQGTAQYFLMNDEEGNIKSCICIFRDNTEIENLQSRIAMSDKLKH